MYVLTYSTLQSIHNKSLLLIETRVPVECILEQFEGLSTLVLWNHVPCSLEGYVEHPRVHHLKARVLVVSEPGSAASITSLLEVGFLEVELVEVLEGVNIRNN